MTDQKNKNFIKLSRKLLDNDLWLSEPFTKGQAWVDLLLLANHEKGMFFLRGNEITVNRGFVARAESNLASRWNWSKNKVRNFIKYLEKVQQIKQHKNPILNQIEILNYDEFQKKVQQTDQQKDYKKTTERLQKDTNKKNKEELKKNKDKTYSIKCHDVVNYFFGFLSEREKERFETSRNSFLDTADKLIRIDKYSIEEINKAVKYAKSDSFWSGVFQSFIKLRNKNKDGIKYIEVFLSKINNHDPKDASQDLPNHDEDGMRNIGVDFQPGDAF